MIVLFLIVASLVGLGLAFLGLALHHERRKYGAITVSAIIRRPEAA